MDTAKLERAETVEKELDRMIERRAQKGEVDPDEREELWKESVRRHNEARRRENAAAWYGWHCDQAERHRRTLEALIAHHEGEAERLLEDEPGEAREVDA